MSPGTDDYVKNDVQSATHGSESAPESETTGNFKNEAQLWTPGLPSAEGDPKFTSVDSLQFLGIPDHLFWPSGLREAV